MDYVLVKPVFKPQMHKLLIKAGLMDDGAAAM